MKAIRGIWRFIKTVGYALTFVFFPRDYPDAGVKIGRLDTCCGLLFQDEFILRR